MLLATISAFTTVVHYSSMAHWLMYLPSLATTTGRRRGRKLAISPVKGRYLLVQQNI